MSRFLGFTQIIIGLFLSITQIPIVGYTQEANWFALSNGMGLTVDLDVDEKGNVYSLGDAREEMEYRSANKNDKTFSSYLSSTSQFIMKHSPEGKLDYVLTIVSMGGSSNSTSTTNLEVLHDNRIAVTVYCKYKFRIIDAFSDSTEITKRGSHLFIFNPNGKLEEDHSLLMDYPSWLSQAENGEIFVMGRQPHYSHFSYNKNATIYKVNLNSKKVERVLAKMEKTCAAIRIIDNTVWILESEVTGSKHYYSSMRYTLSKMSVYDTIHELKSTYEFGLCRSLNAQLIESKGELQLVFSAQKVLATGVELNGQTYKHEKDYSRWFFVNSFGEMIKTFEVKGVLQRDAVLGLKKGGYLFRNMVYDSLIFAKHEPIVPPKHENFVYELCFVKMSPSFDVEEVIYSGGINKTLNAPYIVKNDFLYVTSPIYGKNTIDNISIKIPWSHGFFVRKVSMRKSR